MKTEVNIAVPSRRSVGKRGTAYVLLALFALVALALTLENALALLPPARWWGALWSPDAADVTQLIFHYSLMPRLAVALLVGGGLGRVMLISGVWGFGEGGRILLIDFVDDFNN